MPFFVQKYRFLGYYFCCGLFLKPEGMEDTAVSTKSCVKPAVGWFGIIGLDRLLFFCHSAVIHEDILLIHDFYPAVVFPALRNRMYVDDSWYMGCLVYLVLCPVSFCPALYHVLFYF